MGHSSHVVFIVPDGVGVKNYLFSKVLRHLKPETRVTIWSTLPEATFSVVKQMHNINDIQYRPLELRGESIVTRLYREAATYARLKHNKKITANATILKNWRLPKQNFKLRLLYKLAELMGKWASRKYERILKFEAIAKNNWKRSIVELYKSDLQAMQATTLFITHQRVAGLMPICLAAKEKSIKTSTVIFSWDNLPKARLNVDVDQYLVWSDLMKAEMQQFYKEIDPLNVTVTGTPQFEFYTDENQRTDRNAFARTHGLNPNAKWLCFSGDDELTSPYDPQYLNDIAENLPKSEGPIQIIFRRCPVDFSNRYDAVLERHRNKIVAIDPLWDTQAESWIGYYSKAEDIALQVNLAYHCEAVINLGSTMALDFATFNKPCLYLNYDPIENTDWSTSYIYKFQHFRSMEGLEPVGWINASSEIALQLSEVLHNKTLGKDRVLWLKRLVRFPLDKSSEVIAKKIV